MYIIYIYIYIIYMQYNIYMQCDIHVCNIYANIMGSSNS